MVACSLRPGNSNNVDAPAGKVPDAVEKPQLDSFDEDIKDIGQFETAMRVKTGSPFNPANQITPAVNDLVNAFNTTNCRVDVSQDFAGVSTTDKTSKCTSFAVFSLKKTASGDKFETSTGFSIFDTKLANTNGIRAYFSKWSGQNDGGKMKAKGEGFFFSVKNGRALVSLSAEGDLDANQNVIIAQKLNLTFTYKLFKIQLIADKTLNPPLFKRGLDQITEAAFKEYLGRLGMVIENISL